MTAKESTAESKSSRKESQWAEIGGMWRSQAGRDEAVRSQGGIRQAQERQVACGGGFWAGLSERGRMRMLRIAP